MSETQKSFAERYASKKGSFTSQSLQNDEPEIAAKSENSSTESTQSSILQNKKNLKPIDPQKKMQAELIYLVKGVDAGRNAWYYVLVERLKVQLFLKALNDEIIHLENYGKILFSAYGDEPPEDIPTSLKDEYGIA